MKTLPKLPYLQNIVKYYHKVHGGLAYYNNYPVWLKQFVFEVPVRGEYLIFPEHFSEEDLTIFVLRWS